MSDLNQSKIQNSGSQTKHLLNKICIIGHKYNKITGEILQGSINCIQSQKHSSIEMSSLAQWELLWHICGTVCTTNMVASAAIRQHQNVYFSTRKSNKCSLKGLSGINKWWFGSSSDEQDTLSLFLVENSH